MFARTILFFFLLGFVFVVFFASPFQYETATLPDESLNLGKAVIFEEKISRENMREDPQEIQPPKEIYAPPPLEQTRESSTAFLTLPGTIVWTNVARVNNGLPPLRENAGLTAAAVRKVQDMFEEQYFAHVAPDGKDVEYFVNEAGYVFIAIGENLALGDFENDRVLVEAWMGSPGHRANILNSRYTEIGVAVSQGLYKGRTTWMAVQMFGKPMSACPAADGALALSIDAQKAELDRLFAEIETKEQELKAERSKPTPAYNKKVEEYNALVEEYNALIKETKEAIAVYNAQVSAFNECVKR